MSKSRENKYSNIVQNFHNGRFRIAKVKKKGVTAQWRNGMNPL